MSRVIVAVLIVVALRAPAMAVECSMVPQAAIAAALKQAECDESLADDKRCDEKARALTGGLMLVPILCYRGAYNYSYIFFAADPKAPARARLLGSKHPDGDRLQSCLRSHQLRITTTATRR
jgi:hypothetical protein